MCSLATTTQECGDAVSLCRGERWRFGNHLGDIVGQLRFCVVTAQSVHRGPVRLARVSLRGHYRSGMRGAQLRQ